MLATVLSLLSVTGLSGMLAAFIFFSYQLLQTESLEEVPVKHNEDDPRA
ncbi:hypothetical protein LQF61_11565 [Tetragenococcus koreensis]|uniref:Uncharacterized protein n=1 Tax=Tetragenococcus koreensis TaxID=290335 RepID=A0AAN4RJM2_9ENTE|nr:hypothetical protein [Tetragenococcus koreensis]MCF1586160.1 hypothetical protein [Tetragenococcus koreensis]MCF1615734.1 hypothetical protein [Tetragenococcus koreensis]MCF1618230.1 hypothetical protein [Tetragenococcus koreensis]MCF1620691.1 hypothetical protein [Tetragenococcus koreensis]MCF1623050.1 hypothetical protein [Tetragenococcus koreensis]